MIKERVLQLVEYKGFSKEGFFAKIGMSSANFRGDARKTPLNSSAIENILAEIPEINLEWLITGQGEMLRSTSQELSREDRLLYVIESQQRTIENLSLKL